jgi:prepilin-type N-terminal cleavage/methylation domain-containing protein
VRRHMGDKNRVEQGFSLIELLVVVAILGVLAAVVLFAVGGIRDRGRTSACKAEVSTVNSATQAYFAENRFYPNSTPPDTSVPDLGVTLEASHVLAGGSVLPSATAGDSPAYDPTDGMYSANC